MTAAASPHMTFLATQTVEDVLNEKTDQTPLIDIHVTATVEQVFKTLLANDFLSVPVYRKFNNIKDYVAIIDTYDLLSAMKERGFTFESVSEGNNSFLAEPVAALVGMTKNSSKLWTCTASMPLPQLLKLFTEQRVHRILVLDEIPVRTDQADSDDSIEEDVPPKREPRGRLVSQTDVVRFLLQHNHQLGSILDVSADKVAGHALKFAVLEHNIDKSEAAELKAQPASITIQDQALMALKKMADSNTSSVAILDANGALVAEMSAADLRGLDPTRLADLTRPVIVYLRTSQGDLRRPLSCKSRFLLGQILSGIVRTHAHRSWLVDDEDRPVGCISLSDILSMFLQ